MMHRSFVKKFFVWVLSGILFVMFFNFLIDPFGMHSLTLFQGFNHIKQETAQRLKVALNLIKEKPKAVIFGTSRVKAFSLNDFAEISNEKDVYNAGLAGASFDEIYYYFLHALHVQPDLKKVVLGIDLLSFHEKRKPQSDFSHKRLGRNYFTLEDVRDCFFSFQTLSGSCSSLFSSLSKKNRPNAILEMGEKQYLAQMLRSPDNYDAYKIDQEKIKNFESIVSICKDQGIELKVFICPVKAMYWEFYFQNDLWKPLEQLKRQLCSIYPIWDFSGYNLITTETLDSGGIPLYAECSHFTSYTGKLLLQRMYHQSSVIDSVGYLLTPDTVDAALATILDDRLQWVENAY